MRTALFILFIAGLQQVNAQMIRFDSLFLKSGSIGIEGGIAIPVSDYGSTEFTRAAGYARPGFQYRISAGYEFLPYLGFKLSYVSFQNSVNTGALMSDMQQAYGANGFVFHYSKSDPFKMNGMMAGFYYPLRLFRMTVEVRGLIGYMNSILPANEIRLYDPYRNAERIDVTREATSNDLAYNLGAGIRYKLWKDLLVTGSADFLYSEQHFEGIQSYIRIGSTIYVPSQSEYTQYYHLMQFNLGLAFQFN